MRVLTTTMVGRKGVDDSDFKTIVFLPNTVDYHLRTAVYYVTGAYFVNSEQVGPLSAPDFNKYP